MQVPTGGIAHEPKGTNRWNSDADSKVWMEEASLKKLWMPWIPGLFLFLRGFCMDGKEKYMALALSLAERGRGWTSPNPMVGAVIVKDGRIIGEGWHEKYGEKHAERNALDSATESVEGATMYVTLEPCSHYGKQPPCTDAIIEARLKKVVVGSGDPNPLVNGRGFEILKTHGIEVEYGVLEGECKALNKHFFHYITNKKPYVSLKYAMTVDGKSATEEGVSKWITGEEARRDAHFLRHSHMAIMVGINTVRLDDPVLTCHDPALRDPVRIVVDSNLDIPLSSKLVESAREVPLLIATVSNDEEKRGKLESSGCKVLSIPSSGGKVDVVRLTGEIGKMGIDSILVEGGGTLSWSFVENGLVDHVYAYIAPTLLGGRNALTPLMGKGFPSPDDGLFLENTSIKALGRDYLLEGDVKCSQG